MEDENATNFSSDEQDCPDSAPSPPLAQQVSSVSSQFLQLFQSIVSEQDALKNYFTEELRKRDEIHDDQIEKLNSRLKVVQTMAGQGGGIDESLVVTPEILARREEKLRGSFEEMLSEKNRDIIQRIEELETRVIDDLLCDVKAEEESKEEVDKDVPGAPV